MASASTRPSIIYGTEFRYCGRIITAEGVRYDPRTMSTLQNMDTPQNGGDMVQYMAALNWMRSSLQLFAEKAGPLQDLLEVVYKEAKGRTKKKATSVSLEGRWSTTCEKAFRQLQEDIPTLITTPMQRVCVFTDALVVCSLTPPMHSTQALSRKYRSII
jgi:hypothetical protein